MAEPAGQQHGVAEFDRAETLGRGCDQRLAVEDGRNEVLQDLVVLPPMAQPGRHGARALGPGERLRGNPAELGHRHHVAGGENLIVLEDDATTLGCNLEAVGARRLAGRRDEHGRRAVSEFEVGGDVVFNFDVVIPAEVAEGPDALGQAEHPLQKVEIVRTLVEQHAAAFAGPGGAPGARSVIGLRAEPVGNDPIDATDLAELTTLDQLADLLVVGVGALIEHRRKDLLPVLMRGQEPFAVSFVDRDGFFHQHVQTGLERGDADRDVVKVWCRDEDRVDDPSGDHRVSRGEPWDVRELVKSGGVDVANGGQLEARDLAGADVAGVRCTHVAETDDTKADFIFGGHATGKAGGRLRHDRTALLGPPAKPVRPVIQGRSGRVGLSIPGGGNAMDDSAGLMQTDHGVARSIRNRLVRAIEACLQANPHLHPPSPSLRRTGREHLSAVASCEGRSSLLQL